MAVKIGGVVLKKLKRGVSLIFLLTNPFQYYLSVSVLCVLCVCVCVCVCVHVCACMLCLFTPILLVLFVFQRTSIVL